MLVRPAIGRSRYYNKHECEALGKAAFTEWFSNMVRCTFPSKKLVEGAIDLKALKAISLSPPKSSRVTVYVPYRKRLHVVEAEIFQQQTPLQYITMPTKIWSRGTYTSAVLRNSFEHSVRLMRTAESRFGVTNRVIVSA